jgi:hypothetical protein
MRFVSLTLFLAAAVFAQAPPSGPDQQASPSAEPAAPRQGFQGTFRALTPEQRARNAQRLLQALRAPAAVNVVAPPAPVITAGKPGQACSIPLLNATPPIAQAIDRPMVVPPRSPASSTIRQVTPPAPPCPEESQPETPAPSALNSKP